MKHLKCPQCNRMINPKGRVAKKHAIEGGQTCHITGKAGKPIPSKQQGKPYTPEEKEGIIESLMNMFLLGYNRTKACTAVGFDNTTLNKWEKKDPSLSIKINQQITKVNTKARQNIIKSINDGSVDDSWKWAERKEKDEFSKRSEQIIDDPRQDRSLELLEQIADGK